MVDVGEMASQHLWSANFLLLTEFSEYLPFIYKALPDPLLSPLSRVKMRIDKSSRLSTPVHEEGVFLHLEEERRVRRLIPEKGELGLGHQFYLESFGLAAFEQRYRRTALRVPIPSVKFSIIQSKVNIRPLDARKMDTADNLI